MTGEVICGVMGHVIGAVNLRHARRNGCVAIQ